MMVVFFLVLEISNDFSKRNKIVDASIGNSKKNNITNSAYSTQAWLLVKTPCKC